MIKLIVGKPGSGKTKELIESINKLENHQPTSVVVVEKNVQHSLGILPEIRIVSTDESEIQNYSELYGFIKGILAGNNDISSIYIDDVMLIGGASFVELENFIDKLHKMDFIRSIKYTMSLTDDNGDLPESLRKYL